MSHDKRRQRLRFRSWHRGTREMDLLIGSFADLRLGEFTLDQLDEYEAILELSDPDLYNWMTGLQAVPAAHQSSVMRLLCAHRYAA